MFPQEKGHAMITYSSLWSCVCFCLEALFYYDEQCVNCGKMKTKPPGTHTLNILINSAGASYLSDASRAPSLETDAAHHIPSLTASTGHKAQLQALSIPAWARERTWVTMIDLSHLTEEEQAMIMTVLKRDEELKKAEEERIKWVCDSHILTALNHDCVISVFPSFHIFW